MSVASLTDARDEMLALFKAAWDGAPASANVPVRYPDRKEDKPPSGAPWARVSVTHANSGQATLANHDGKRKFTRNGVITVQIFTPFGRGSNDADALAKIAQDAFEGKATANQIWFRDVTVNEIGQDGEWNQTNVLATFTYDEVK